MQPLQLAQFIFLAPAAAFLFLAFFHKKLPRHGDFIATGVMGVCFLAALAIFGQAAFSDTPLFVHWTFDFIPVSASKTLPGGILIDGLTAVMLVVVTLVSFLVHLFSTAYMHGDVRYGRYYCSLLLFSMSMLGLVLADSILFLFIFWELVGLSSYLLIGHWYEKKSANNAAIKAFITTRIGDVGMLLGMLICYWKVGSLEYADVFAAAGNPAIFDGDWQLWAGLGLFFGAMGKSAQWPLHVWLPDAMEGPTPVSALIHAATMVAAGVYLVGRLYPIFTPEAFLVIAYIGAITALFAASIATVQDDIKKVLAYSTLSQLGYMMLALGVGGYFAGLFHLTTHAFFKAGLFLGSGSVIHAMHHEQSLSKYGGLRKKLPITWATYGICVLAIAGVPGLAGFFSKDAILADTLAFAQEHGEHWFLAFSGFFTALLTAYYMFRQFLLTFYGKPRDRHAYDHAHESPLAMTIPLMVLALLAFVSGWGGLNHETHKGWFDGLMPPHEKAGILEQYQAYHSGRGEPVSELVTAALAGGHAPAADAHAEEARAAGEEHAAGDHAEHGGHGNAHTIAMVLSIVLAFLGIGIAFAAYWERANGTTVINPALVARRIRPLHTLLLKKYYFDEMYGFVFVGGTMILMRFLAAFDKYVIDGIVNLAGLAYRFASMATGIFDNIVVDGAVNGAALLSSLLGDGISYSQTGRARNYLAFIVLGVLGLSVILMIAI